LDKHEQAALLMAAPKEPSEEKHDHWKAEDITLSNCPECQKEVDKIGKAFMEKTLKERSSLPYVCEGCGLGVRKEEESCPSCGGKRAKSRHL
jgi:rubrerythrin